MFFIKSRARLARLAAILSIFMLPAWTIILALYLRYGRNVF